MLWFAVLLLTIPLAGLAQPRGPARSAPPGASQPARLNPVLDPRAAEVCREWEAARKELPTARFGLLERRCAGESLPLPPSTGGAAALAQAYRAKAAQRIELCTGYHGYLSEVRSRNKTAATPMMARLASLRQTCGEPGGPPPAMKTFTCRSRDGKGGVDTYTAECATNWLEEWIFQMDSCDIVGKPGGVCSSAQSWVSWQVN